MRIFLGVFAALAIGAAQNGQAASTGYAFSCTLVKEGEVSPLDEGLSTMEGYNKIWATVALGGSRNAPVPILVKGALGGFRLDPRDGDRIWVSMDARVEYVVMARRVWGGDRYVLLIRKDAPVRNSKGYYWGAVYYQAEGSRTRVNAGTLICRSKVL